MKYFLSVLSLFLVFSSRTVLATNDNPDPTDSKTAPSVAPSDPPVTVQPTEPIVVYPSPTDVPVSRPTATPAPSRQQPRQRQNTTATPVPTYVPTSTPSPSPITTPATPTDKPTPEQSIGQVVKNSYHPSPTPIPNVVNVFSEPNLYASSKFAPLYTTGLIIVAVVTFLFGYSLVDKTPHSLPRKIEERVIFNRNRLFSLPVLRSLL